MNIIGRRFRFAKIFCVFCVALFCVGLSLFLPSISVRAGGVVGTGTAASCTEAALDSALSGGGTVTFNCGSSPVTIILTHQKVISVDTTINGAGLITLTGAGSERLFAVAQANPKIIFTIQNINLTNGNTSSNNSAGGAIYTFGNLNILNSSFYNNNAGFSSGGAISSALDVNITISDSKFNNNISSGYALSMYGSLTISNSVFNNNASGAILATGNVFITNSVLSNNRAYNYDGGGIAGSGNFTIINSTISNNEGSYGGGIYNCTGSLNIQNSIVYNNHAIHDGGGIVSCNNLLINNSAIINNSVGVDALEPCAGGLSISGSNNTITNSIIANNKAFCGGGIRAGIVTLINSVVSNNQAVYDGGGIYQERNGLTLINSTVSDNTTKGKGGGIYNSTNSTINITNSTIANNTAPVGGNIYAADSFLAPITLTNTIVANSNGSANCNTLLTNGNGNLQYPGNSCGAGITSADPKLGPLQNNRGPTKTMALLPGSAAIDTANAASCQATDQRGVTRPQGAGCDIGAFEVYAGNPVLVVTNPNDDGQGGLPNSLSTALNQATANAGIQTINFNVAGGVITVGGALPVVPTGLSIDGGSCTNRITLNGATAPQNTIGLVPGDYVTLKNLIVTKFKDSQLKSNGVGNKLICVSAIK